MGEILAPAFWVFVLINAGIYTIFALGLQLQYGVAGLMNFGAVALMGLSAYAMVIAIISWQIPFLLACLLALVVAGLGGAFLGLIARRLRGDYFAIVTIAFSETFRYIAKNASDFTGGDQGSLAIPSDEPTSSYVGPWNAFSASISSGVENLIGLTMGRDIVMLVVIWLIAGVLMFLIARLERMPWATVLRASREGDVVPDSLGKRVGVMRTQVLIIGSVLGGVAGIFFALQFSFIQPNNFEPLATFFAWTIILLGGATRVIGVPVGALIFGFIFAGTRFFDFPPFSWFESADRAYLRLIIVGLILIAIVMWRPQGILGRRKEMILE